MKRNYFLLATALMGIPLMAQEKDSLSTKQKTPDTEENRDA